MTDQTLTNYIKQTLAAGFAEEKIRQALKEAGWQEQEIAEEFAALKAPPETKIEASFFTRHRRALISSLIIIVALPIVAYGAFWTYQKLTSQKESPETIYPPPAAVPEEETVKGEIASPSSNLEITDLSQTPFYPGEEVHLEINRLPNQAITHAMLVMSASGGPEIILDLIDRNPPFGFRFSAPKNPGNYQVKVFVFDEYGKSFSQTATLTVQR